MSQDLLINYLFLGLAAILIWYLIISYATRADRQVKNQRAIIDLLGKLCEKNGVTREELDIIKNARDIR